MDYLDLLSRLKMFHVLRDFVSSIFSENNIKINTKNMFLRHIVFIRHKEAFLIERICSCFTARKGSVSRLHVPLFFKNSTVILIKNQNSWEDRFSVDFSKRNWRYHTQRAITGQILVKCVETFWIACNPEKGKLFLFVFIGAVFIYLVSFALKSSVDFSTNV